MNKYIIEREIPKIGDFTAKQLCEASRTSNSALVKLGTDVQWIESYVTADKTFCVYLAKDEAMVKRHAEISGFPANKITKVTSMIDPTTAN